MSAGNAHAPQITTEIDPADWDRFVGNHSDGTSYHLWHWRSVYERAFGHRCHYLAVQRDGSISGVLPLVEVRSWLFGKFAVSLPFVNYGGVLAADELSANVLLAAATELAHRKGLSHIELRHRTRIFDELAAKRHKVAMLLPLSRDIDSMWTGLDRKVRNQTRKAEKSGLTSEVGGAELVEPFYDVFASRMRDLGTPVYSRAFFETIVATFPSTTRVFLVRRGPTAVAAGISCEHRDVLEVPWASSLKEYRDQCPNNLLYWHVIRYAIERGLRQLDFGRSTPGEGTFHFKQQWGARPEPLCWEYRLLSRQTVPDQSPKNPRFRLAIEAWKRLPLGMTKLIGPSIVRGIP